jgi:hypothetical protein
MAMAENLVKGSTGKAEKNTALHFAKAVKLLYKTRLPGIRPASIAYDPEGIWVADVESGDIFLIQYETGKVIDQFPSLVRRPQTISTCEGCLWEWDEETMDLYRRSISTDERSYFGKVDGVHTPYLGQAHQDKTLWLLSPDQPHFTVSDNIITVIKFPRRIKAIEFKAPTHACRGLCHDGTYLWTLDVEDKVVYALSPDNGLIITSYLLPEVFSPSSIVVTDDKIWTIDLMTNKLLTYSLDREQKITSSGGRRSLIEIVETTRNSGPGTINSLKLSQTLPEDYVNQKMVRKSSVVPEPSYTLKGQWGDENDKGTVVVHNIQDLEAGEERTITVSFEIDTVNLKWHIYPHKTGRLEDIPEDIKKKYLFSAMLSRGDDQLTQIVKTAQTLFQTENKLIKEKVREILDDETNPCLMARKIYNFVVEKVDYILPYSSISTETILKQGKGSCGNHATVFIALCQAAGLPARSIIGWGIWKEDSRLGYMDHEIPEVYLPSYGWVPADTSRFMALPVKGNAPLDFYRSFGSLSDRFFINGFGRDMTSESAREYYENEKFITTDGECRPESLMFLRWESKAIEE